MLTANVISGFAQGITVIAIPWYFITALNESSLYGVLFTTVTIATLFWSLYAGTLIDRYDRKRIFVWMNATGFLSQGLIALYGFVSGVPPIWMVATSFALTIFIFNIHYPAIYAFAQEITVSNNYGKVNSMLEVQGQTTSMLAGGFAALLLAGSPGLPVSIQELLPFSMRPWGIHEVIALDAATYLLAFLIVLAIRYEAITKREIDTSPIRERFKLGFAYLQQNPQIYLFGIASYMVFVVLIAEGFYLIPMYVNKHLQEGADVLALGEVVYSTGAILAGIMVNRLFGKNRPVLGIILLMIICILILVWVAFTKSILVFVIFSLFMGLTNAGIRVLRITYLFRVIPNHIIGRASSIFNSYNILMRSILIGVFSMAFFSESNNVTWAYFICSLVVVAGLIPILINYKKIRLPDDVDEK